jgi:hypothetical protein
MRSPLVVGMIMCRPSPSVSLVPGSSRSHDCQAMQVISAHQRQIVLIDVVITQDHARL